MNEKDIHIEIDGDSAMLGVVASAHVLLQRAINEALDSAKCKSLNPETLVEDKDILHVYDTEKVLPLSKSNEKAILKEIVDFINEKESELYNMTLASMYEYTIAQIVTE